MTHPAPRTLFQKLWDLHCVANEPDGGALIAIDRVFLHDRTGSVALKSLKEAERRVADPKRTFLIMDHIVSFRAGRGRDEARAPGGEAFITQSRALASEAGLRLVDTDDSRQGIVHVVAPELGAVTPGLTAICPDSHTCSLGALGALAWGVGSSESEHAMATGVVRLKAPQQMRVRLDGVMAPDVTAKDLALALISAHGAAGGKRSAIEFAGDAVTAMSLEERLTLANLAVEFAAFTAVIAPDEKVFSYLKGRPFAPSGPAWDAAVEHWRTLRTDPGASFDAEITLDAAQVRPMITWGTSPEHAGPIDAPIPAGAPPRALAYMGLKPGETVRGKPIQGAFIGSCTNGRLSDLEAAAAVLKGRRVAEGVRAVCVPGSRSVEAAAQAAGLDRVFLDAGFEWGAPGCAMCFYAGGETFAPEARVVSSTNRNFEGRQGPGVRTHLASPATVAASAVAGAIVSAADVRAKGA